MNQTLTFALLLTAATASAFAGVTWGTNYQ